MSWYSAEESAAEAETLGRRGLTLRGELEPACGKKRQEVPCSGHEGVKSRETAAERKDRTSLCKVEEIEEGGFPEGDRGESFLNSRHATAASSQGCETRRFNPQRTRSGGTPRGQ